MTRMEQAAPDKLSKNITFRCYAELSPKSREDIQHLVSQETLQYFQEFFFCPSCRKVYWKGSHFKRMESYIRDLAYFLK